MVCRTTGPRNATDSDGAPEEQRHPLEKPVRRGRRYPCHLPSRAVICPLMPRKARHPLILGIVEDIVNVAPFTSCVEWREEMGLEVGGSSASKGQGYLSYEVDP